MSVFAVHLILLNIGYRIAFLKEVRYAGRRDPFSQLPLTNHQAYLILLRSAICYLTPENKPCQSRGELPFSPSFTSKVTLQA